MIDEDIQDLINSDEADAGFELLWQRYRLPCVQFLAQRHPSAPDDEIASAVTDAFLQLYQNPPGTGRPIRNHLFLVANRRLIDGLRKRGAQRRGGMVEWVELDDPDVAEPVKDSDQDQFQFDDVAVNEMRARLERVYEELRPGHQRSLLIIICEALPDRVYLADFPDLMRERGLTPPCMATLKRALTELRRRLASDPVLRKLKPQYP